MMNIQPFSGAIFVHNRKVSKSDNQPTLFQVAAVADNEQELKVGDWILAETQAGMKHQLFENDGAERATYLIVKKGEVLAIEEKQEEAPKATKKKGK